MKKKISGVKKKQKKIGHRTFYFLSPEAWVDIIPNRVRVGNFIYRGIIDLRDPSGKYLVLLYANLPGGVKVVKNIVMNQERLLHALGQL